MAKNVLLGYGNVGRLVAEELKAAGQDVVVARHSQTSDSGGFASVTVEALDQDSVTKALKGAERVFVTIGLPYKLVVWQRQWPTAIQNIILACKDNGTKLVFLDNIYLYGPTPLQSPITERHPRQPASRKGALRLQLVQMLESAMVDGVDVAIVRCPDFYGPSVSSSSVTMSIDAALAGKPAYFVGDATTLHTYAYVPDVAKAMVRIALEADAYGQTWHVPTAGAITGSNLMALIADALGKSPKWSMLRAGFKLRLMGLAVPVLGELAEMMYQFESEYVFDSTKFRAGFPDFVATDYPQGIAATVAAAKKSLA